MWSVIQNNPQNKVVFYIFMCGVIFWQPQSKCGIYSKALSRFCNHCKNINVLTTNRIATVRENKFYLKSGKSHAGVLYQVRKFLNSCSKSVKSQGILSCILSFALFYLDQLVTQRSSEWGHQHQEWGTLGDIGWPVFSLFNHLQMCLHNQEKVVTLDLS